MSTLFHSFEQGIGWAVGGLCGIVGSVGLLSIRRVFQNPLRSLSRKEQHRLFQGYWNHLERKERYEEMEALTEVMLAYQDEKQPTRKQLKPYKLVVKKKMSLKGDGIKFITKRHISRADA